MMSERKSIENSRKRYQTFITSKRKPKKRSNSSSGNPITSSNITGSGDLITSSNITGSGDPITSSGDLITSSNIIGSGDPIISSNVTGSSDPIISSGSGKFITKKSGGSEPMTRDRSSSSEPISINRNRPITFKKWGMKSNEEGNLIHLGPGIIMPC